MLRDNLDNPIGIAGIRGENVKIEPFEGGVTLSDATFFEFDKENVPPLHAEVTKNVQILLIFIPLITKK